MSVGRTSTYSLIICGKNDIKNLPSPENIKDDSYNVNVCCFNASCFFLCLGRKFNTESFEAIDFESNNDVIDSVMTEMSKVKNDLPNSAQTKLWLLHLDMVQILINNLIAECRGLWDLYLHTLDQMIPVPTHFRPDDTCTYTL